MGAGRFYWSLEDRVGGWQDRQVCALQKCIPPWPPHMCSWHCGSDLGACELSLLLPPFTSSLENMKASSLEQEQLLPHWKILEPPLKTEPCGGTQAGWDCLRLSQMPRGLALKVEVESEVLSPPPESWSCGVNPELLGGLEAWLSAPHFLMELPSPRCSRD